MRACVCASVCVCERERSTEIGKGGSSIRRGEDIGSMSIDIPFISINFSTLLRHPLQSVCQKEREIKRVRERERLIVGERVRDIG